jgi:hypothetical protein
MSDNPNSRLALCYVLAECGFDVATAVIIYTQGHPWWALAWCVLNGIGANGAAKRLAVSAAGSGDRKP